MVFVKNKKSKEKQNRCLILNSPKTIAFMVTTRQDSKLTKFFQHYVQIHTRNMCILLYLFLKINFEPDKNLRRTHKQQHKFGQWLDRRKTIFRKLKPYDNDHCYTNNNAIEKE